MNKNYNCKLNNGGIFIKSKLIIVALSLFVLICSLSCVSAVADNQTDFSAQVDVEEETLTCLSVPPLFERKGGGHRLIVTLPNSSILYLFSLPCLFL